jgi:hypothetical protein
VGERRITGLLERFIYWTQSLTMSKRMALTGAVTGLAEEEAAQMAAVRRGPPVTAWQGAQPPMPGTAGRRGSVPRVEGVAAVGRGRRGDMPAGAVLPTTRLWACIALGPDGGSDGLIKQWIGGYDREKRELMVVRGALPCCRSAHGLTTPATTPNRALFSQLYHNSTIDIILEQKTA